MLLLTGVALSRRLELLLLHLPLGGEGEGGRLPGLLRRAPALLTIPEARLQQNVRTLLALCPSAPAFEALAARHPRLLTGGGLASQLKAMEALLQNALFPPPAAPAKGKAAAAAKKAAKAAKGKAAAAGAADPGAKPSPVVSGVAAAVVRAHPLVLAASPANQRWAVDLLRAVAELVSEGRGGQISAAEEQQQLLPLAEESMHPSWLQASAAWSLPGCRRFLQSPGWREELRGMAAAAAAAAAAREVVALRPEDSRYLREEAAAAAAEAAEEAEEEAGGAAAAAGQEPPAAQPPPGGGAAAAADPSAAVAELGKLLSAPAPALLRLWYLARRYPELAEEESMAAVVGLSPDAAEALLPGVGAWAAAELGEAREQPAAAEL